MHGSRTRGQDAASLAPKDVEHLEATEARAHTGSRCAEDYSYPIFDVPASPPSQGWLVGLPRAWWGARIPQEMIATRAGKCPTRLQLLGFLGYGTWGAVVVGLRPRVRNEKVSCALAEGEGRRRTWPRAEALLRRTDVVLIDVRAQLTRPARGDAGTSLVVCHNEPRRLSCPARSGPRLPRVMAAVDVYEGRWGQVPLCCAGESLEPRPGET